MLLWGVQGPRDQMLGPSHVMRGPIIIVKLWLSQERSGVFVRGDLQVSFLPSFGVRHALGERGVR